MFSSTEHLFLSHLNGGDRIKNNDNNNNDNNNNDNNNNDNNNNNTVTVMDLVLGGV